MRPLTPDRKLAAAVPNRGGGSLARLALSSSSGLTLALVLALARLPPSPPPPYSLTFADAVRTRGGRISRESLAVRTDGSRSSECSSAAAALRLSVDAASRAERAGVAVAVVESAWLRFRRRSLCIASRSRQFLQYAEPLNCVPAEAMQSSDFVHVLETQTCAIGAEHAQSRKTISALPRTAARSAVNPDLIMHSRAFTTHSVRRCRTCGRHRRLQGCGSSSTAGRSAWSRRQW